MSDESTTFSVNDRRNFTAEGELKSAGATEAESHAGAEGSPAFPDAAVDLSSFLLSQALHARTLLADPPAQMSRAEALGGARYFISVIEMLGRRTEGNRTEEESSLLEALLFELRMSYVESVRESQK